MRPDLEVITLNRRGIWLSDGLEITHEPTCRTFARGLTRDAEGYLIRIAYESKRVIVEDTPFFVVRLDGSMLTLNDGTQEPLHAEKLTYDGQILRTRLQKCDELGQPFAAAFLSTPFMELMRQLQEDETTYFLSLGGIKVTLAHKL